MDYKPTELPHKIREAGYILAERIHDAELQEEKKKIVFAELCNLAEGSIAAKEKAALADKKYLEQVRKAIEARRGANKAKAYLEGVRTQFELWRSLEATERSINK